MTMIGSGRPVITDADLQFCRVRRHGRLLEVTLNRPDALNALYAPCHLELSSVWDAFAADGDLWVAILTGEGSRAFCVGNDLKAAAAQVPKPYLATGFGGLTARFDLDKPIIAAVNGYALGGGFEMALACDVVIASENAKFGLPEPKVGLAALAGGIHRLMRQIPHKRAMGMLLTGELVSALDGLDLGFVNEVVPPGDALDGARRWAERVLACSPMSIRATKQCAYKGLSETSLEAAIRNRYPAAMVLLESEDALEGPRSFAEKRPPIWKNR